jgi:hypothetical protein
MMASGKNAKKNRAKAPVVTRRQGLPWVTIGAVVVILALVGVIFFVVFQKKSDNDAAAAAASAAQSSAAAAGASFVPSADNQDPSLKIDGIFAGKSTAGSNGGPMTYPEYDNRIHVSSDQRVAYDRYPPIGGPHDQTWAACNGVVYGKAVRVENMVHTLEHGAVWIAYNPDTISDADLTTLKNLVTGGQYITLTPYPGLDSTISLQAWAHQLKVDSASDPRIGEFITALRLNPYVYPETGATCEQPSFDIDNPPAFETSPPGDDAVPMSGEGATGTTMSGDTAATGAEQTTDSAAATETSSTEPASTEPEATTSSAAAASSSG